MFNTLAQRSYALQGGIRKSMLLPADSRTTLTPHSCLGSEGKVCLSYVSFSPPINRWHAEQSFSVEGDQKRALSPGYSSAFWRPKPEAWREPGLQTGSASTSLFLSLFLSAPLPPPGQTVEASDCLHFLYLIV